ncbi:MAG: hypothetical protein ACR2G3_09485 [Solirubrobacterales bacterium]
MTRHLLTGSELEESEIAALVVRAREIKDDRFRGEGASSLSGEKVVLFF